MPQDDDDILNRLKDHLGSMSEEDVHEEVTQGILALRDHIERNMLPGLVREIETKMTHLIDQNLQEIRDQIRDLEQRAEELPEVLKAIMSSIKIELPARRVEKTIEYDGMSRPYKIQERELSDDGDKPS